MNTNLFASSRMVFLSIFYTKNDKDGAHEGDSRVNGLLTMMETSDVEFENSEI